MQSRTSFGSDRIDIMMRMTSQRTAAQPKEALYGIRSFPYKVISYRDNRWQKHSFPLSSARFYFSFTVRYIEQSGRSFWFFNWKGITDEICLENRSYSWDLLVQQVWHVRPALRAVLHAPLHPAGWSNIKDVTIHYSNHDCQTFPSLKRFVNQETISQSNIFELW